MKPSFDDNLQNLAGALSTWRAMRPSLPNEVNVQGLVISTDSLGQLFDNVMRTMEVVNSSEQIDPAILASQAASITTFTSQVLQHMASSETQGAAWLASTINSLHSPLWGLYSCLSWLVPIQDLLVSDTARLRISELIAQAASIQRSADEVSNILHSIRVQGTKAFESGEFVEEIKKEIPVELAAIKEASQAANTAKTNAEASAANAVAEWQKIEQVITDLNAAVTQKNTLFAEFENFREKVEGLLEGASKVGLARSFTQRREWLDTSRFWWVALFLVGITALATIGVSVFADVGKLTQLVDENGKVQLGQAIARLLLAGPPVWITWFAARQYSYTMRLAEDYAFKEAAALAFVGYRTEMGADAEMLKLLQESAIRTFGHNPARLLGQSNAASPLHDAIEQAIDKGYWDKATDLLKAVAPARKV